MDCTLQVILHSTIQTRMHIINTGLKLSLFKAVTKSQTLVSVAREVKKGEGEYEDDMGAQVAAKGSWHVWSLFSTTPSHGQSMLFCNSVLSEPRGQVEDYMSKSALLRPNQK